MAVEGAPGLARYQIVQEAVDRFTVRAQAAADVAADTASRIGEVVRAAVDSSVAVDVVWEGDLELPRRQKFRVDTSRVAGGACA